MSFQLSKSKQYSVLMLQYTSKFAEL